MKKAIIFLFVILLMPIAAYSQGATTGSIEGIITDVNGEPLPAATVIAEHMPTGTEYGTASRADGGYTFKSVRVGGPYEIRVTFIGFNSQIKEISRIELGERATLNFTLEEGSLTLDEISVTATVDETFNSERTGARTNISSEEIERTPSVARSLGDFTRLTPQVTSGNSFGGANNRYNNIQVDGATLNDVFGLGEATPGSQAGVGAPLSIDAIAEFNVDIAPFDVTNNGFTGGQINAITKSGTNTFTGSVYFQGRNQNVIGNYEINGETSADYPEFTERYFGLSIGGPIIKDKLFFFVNAELKREVNPMTGGILGSNAANVFDVSTQTMNQIADILINQYNYDPGAFTSPLDADENNNKVLAKLDWNINQNHKLSLRYNYVDAIANRGISRSSDSFTFSNRQYDFNSLQHSVVAELTSTFGNNSYNEARIVYTRIRDSRDVPSQLFPSVTVEVPFENSDETGFVNFGVEQYSQANRLDQDLIEFTNNFTYISGDHEITLGTSNQMFTFDNLFVRNAFGAYEFEGIDDLAAGNPASYELSYLLDGGNRTATFTGIQFGLYAQDQWSLNNYFKITYGLRIDVPVFPDTPTNNPLIPQAFPEYSTENIASGNILWSPRIGFNWDASNGQRITQIRGGIGIFSGTPPFVWISNQYANTGVDYGRVDASDGETDALGDGFFSPDPQNQPRPGDHPALQPINTSEVNLIKDDFKYPQALKVNLAVDQELPYGIVGTLEGIYSKTLNDVSFTNINLEQVGTSAHGRPVYGEVYLSRFGTASGNPARINPNFTDVIVLGNTNDGYQYSITGELEKSFDSGVFAKLAYTYNRALNVNNGSSSQARSNWIYNENVDINDTQPGTADFERRHRILGVLSYTLNWTNRLATTFSVIYDGRSGTPYSWVYNGDANGDGEYTNDLIYVPASEDEVVLESNNWNELNNWIEGEDDLSEARGEFIDRNTAREPWTNFLDFKISQEIMTFGNQSIEISASLINALNLVNPEWGVRRGVAFNSHLAIDFREYVDQEYVDANPGMVTEADIGKPVISFSADEQTDDRKYDVSDFSSRWQMLFSVRYNF